nr:hypothetical protein [Tanacetum cinerariifolium]
MNSYTFMGIDDVEEGEEISSRKKSFIKRAIAYINIRRQASRLTRNSITRDRSGAHERLVAAFFSITRYEYMQISERSSCMALDHFCEDVMEIYGPDFLRKPTVTDIEKLYRHHEEKHGFLGMLGSLDCTDWKWFGCPYAFKGQFVRRDHADDDHRRILYKQKQESARKDVKRAFGVLMKKLVVLANLTRAQKKERLVNMMYTCIILHNMIREYKKVAISLKWFREEAHQPEDLLRNEEQMKRVMRWIGSSQAHQNLRHDLIEHLSRNV